MASGGRLSDVLPGVHRCCHELWSTDNMSHTQYTASLQCAPQSARLESFASPDLKMHSSSVWHAFNCCLQHLGARHAHNSIVKGCDYDRNGLAVIIGNNLQTVCCISGSLALLIMAPVCQQNKANQSKTKISNICCQQVSRGMQCRSGANLVQMFRHHTRPVGSCQYPAS